MLEYSITCIPNIYTAPNTLFVPFLFSQEIHVRDFGGKLVITAFVLNALIG